MAVDSYQLFFLIKIITRKLNSCANREILILLIYYEIIVVRPRRFVFLFSTTHHLRAENLRSYVAQVISLARCRLDFEQSGRPTNIS
jgi:hypothetical protein